MTRVPDRAEVATVHERTDGVRIEIAPRPGQRLSELPDSDGEGFVLARIFVAGHTEYEMSQKYQACAAALRFGFDAA